MTAGPVLLPAARSTRVGCLREFVARLAFAGLRHDLFRAIDDLAPLPDQLVCGCRTAVEMRALRQRHVCGLERSRASAQYRLGWGTVGDEHERAWTYAMRHQQVKFGLRPQGCEHLSRRDWRDAVHADVVPGTLERRRVHQAHERHLRCTVVVLAEVTVEARRRRRHHDAAVVVIAHVRPDGLGAMDGAHGGVRGYAEHHLRLEPSALDNMRRVLTRVPAAPFARGSTLGIRPWTLARFSAGTLPLSVGPLISDGIRGLFARRCRCIARDLALRTTRCASPGRRRSGWRRP